MKDKRVISAKIEVDSVETDSIKIFVGRQSWTYDHVVAGFEFQNFSFST